MTFTAALQTGDPLPPFLLFYPHNLTFLSFDLPASALTRASTYPISLTAWDPNLSWASLSFNLTLAPPIVSA